MRHTLEALAITADAWSGSSWRSELSHNRGNLQSISLHLPDVPYGHGVDCIDPADVKGRIGDDMYSQWLEFDQLLVQLWESHSIRPKVTCYAPPLENWCN